MGIRKIIVFKKVIREKLIKLLPFQLLMLIDELKALEEESSRRKIPILGREKGAWLLQIVKEAKPQRVLELGTANGYSGIILGSGGAELTTIEINGKIAEEAMRNFARFNVKAQVIIGDGKKIVEEIVQKLKSPYGFYDLIFIDFSKNNYLAVLDGCLKLAGEGGLIIADNITNEKCRDFKEAVLRHPQLRTEIIKIKDGLSCSVKVF